MENEGDGSFGLVFFRLARFSVFSTKSASQGLHSCSRSSTRKPEAARCDEQLGKELKAAYKWHPETTA